MSDRHLRECVLEAVDTATKELRRQGSTGGREVTEPDERGFSYQTVAAVAVAVLIPAVILVGEYRRAAYYQQERENNGQTQYGHGVGLDGQGRDGNARPADTIIDENPLPETRPAGTGAAGPSTRPVSRFPAGVSNGRGGGTLRLAAAERRLLDAIRQVESGGNDRAIGDGGRSVGPYQCGRAAWLDGGGKAADYPRLAYSRAETEKIMLVFWARYGAVSDEAMARTWNGGPKGMKKAATLPYWRKVQAAKGDSQCQ